MTTAIRPLASPLPFRYLLLAAFLHGLALFCLRLNLPAWSGPAAPLRLEIRLAPWPAASPPAANPETAPEILHPSGPVGMTAGRPGAGATGDRPPPTADTTSSRPETTAPSGSELAADARAFIRSESRRRSGDPMHQPPQPSWPPSSAIERAAARPAAGEKLLREGVIKITSPDGSSYCLLRPPEVANRDGPATVLSIPMTCPIEF